MQVAGVVCEYNPFHTGHAFHLRETRRMLGADTAVVCVMSGNFVQRGDFALLRKHARAEAAVRCGADLVLELPTVYAAASAERFASAAVTLLKATGLVDTLSFGSECGELSALREAAEALLSADFPPLLRRELERGVSFAAARQAALGRLIGPESAGRIAEPNNILAVEYLKAAKRLGGLSAVTVPRLGAGHDSAETGGYASASELRRRLLAGEDASAFLPPAMEEIFARERAAGRAPVRVETAERAILARFRTMEEADFAPYDEGSEGLYRRFYTAARRAATVEELLAEVKTKRYAYARLRRMLLRSYLGLPAVGEPAYLRVLACNDTGRGLLARMRTAAALPVLTKPAEARKLPEIPRRMFEAESRCTDLYALAYPAQSEARGGGEWITGAVLVPADA